MTTKDATERAALRTSPLANSPLTGSAESAICRSRTPRVPKRALTMRAVGTWLLVGAAGKHGRDPRQFGLGLRVQRAGGGQELLDPRAGLRLTVAPGPKLPAGPGTDAAAAPGRGPGTSARRPGCPPRPAAAQVTRCGPGRAVAGPPAQLAPGGARRGDVQPRRRRANDHEMGTQMRAPRSPRCPPARH